MEASVNVGGRLLRLLSASVHVALSGHRNGTPDSLMIWLAGDVDGLPNAASRFNKLLFFFFFYLFVMTQNE